jgi:hypothetical protein
MKHLLIAGDMLVMHQHGRSHSHQRYCRRSDLPAANGRIVVEDVPTIEEDERGERVMGESERIWQPGPTQ